MLTRILNMRCRDERCSLEFEIKQLAFDEQDELRLEGILCPGPIHSVFYGSAGNVVNIGVSHDKLPDYVANAGFQVPGKVLPRNKAVEEYAENLRNEIEAEKKAQAERDRLEAEVQLKEQIRERFLTVNTAASEQDFERLYPQLRDQHLIESVGIRSTEQNYIEAVYGDSK
jgi:hypothetical protein